MFKSISSKSVKAKSFMNKSQRVNSKYLSELYKIQSSFQNENNKNFFSNEEPEIKDYGAVYMSTDGKSFEITNDRNFKASASGKKVVELNFQKTLFEKG
jgi:hypothetical protein